MRNFFWIILFGSLLQHGTVFGAKKFATDCASRFKVFLEKSESVRFPVAVKHPEIKLTVTGVLKDKQIDELKAPIFAVDRSLQNQLDTPDVVHLDVYEKGAVAHSDSSGKIAIAYKFSPKDEASKHPVFMRGIVAHEYAHLLYYVNTKKRSPNIFGTYFRDNDELARLRPEWEKSFVSAGYNPERTEEETKKLHKVIEELALKIDALSPNVQRAAKIIEPLNELFADIVAVATYRDPQIITRALSFTKLQWSQMKPKALLRDFERRDRIDFWADNSAHNQFAPARQYVWKYILSNPEYNHNLGETISKILDVIIAESAVRFKDPSLDALSPAEVNRRLIKALDVEFRIK